MQRLISLISCSAVLLLGACNLHSSDEPPDNSDPMVVAASAGTTPIYSWNGSAAVSISVAQTSAPTVEVWGVSNVDQRNIPSGTRHGVIPEGAVETASAQRVLTAGVHYRVTISRNDGKTAFTDFTP